jgi:hypothetical protein
MSYLKHAKSHKLDAPAFRTFMFQGRALFTLENKEAGTDITFTVKSLKRKRKDPEETRYFDVHVKETNGQPHSYYIGRIDRKDKKFRSSMDQDNVGVKTINWIIEHWNDLEKFEEDGKLGMYHLGICCKCGMTLIVDDSIENGIGPHCRKYREHRTLQLIKELGLYIPGASYKEQIINACVNDTAHFDKYFIPETIRRSSEWVQRVETWSAFGLI